MGVVISGNTSGSVSGSTIVYGPATTAEGAQSKPTLTLATPDADPADFLIPDPLATPPFLHGSGIPIVSSPNYALNLYISFCVVFSNLSHNFQISLPF